MKKSQGAIEFLLIMLFVFFLLAIILYAVGKFSIDNEQQSIQAERDDFANSILHEIDLLQKVQNGYTREFIIPQKVMGRFNLTINSSIGYISIIDLNHDDPEDNDIYYYEVPSRNNFNAYIYQDLDLNYRVILTKGLLNLSTAISLQNISN